METIERMIYKGLALPTARMCPEKIRLKMS
jgi:hypothetical protein